MFPDLSPSHHGWAFDFWRALQCESKKFPQGDLTFFSFFFHKRWKFLIDVLHTYYTFLSTLDYKFLSPILTKLCHIKRDYLVHVICLKCPPSAKTHAFRRLPKSLIALLIVICGKSQWNKHFYNINKHVGYDMNVSNDVICSVNKLWSYSSSEM